MHTEAAMLLTGDTLVTLAVAVAVFLLLVDQMHRHSRWAARYPPGPMPLPGLGNLLQVNFQDPLLSFSQVRKVGVGSGQRRSWGPHLAADSGWWVKSQAGKGTGPRGGGKFERLPKGGHLFRAREQFGFSQQRSKRAKAREWGSTTWQQAGDSAGQLLHYVSLSPL